MFSIFGKATFRPMRASRPATLTARFSSTFPQWPTSRQTPGGLGRWKDVQFHVDSEVEECDVWFIYEGLARPQRAVCPPENVVFITAEPPVIKEYDAKWLRQFAHVISCQRNLRHSAVQLSQMALPWHVGKSYDELAGKPFPHKSKSWSAIASNKDFAPGHRLRLAFIEELRQHKGGDIFGRGIRELPVKWDGLADYRYSVAIENCQYPDYWTEKIADCFLAGTVPFYFGCINIADFFPAESFVWINVEQPEQAIRQMDEVLAANDYEQRVPALQKAKSLVLNDYNVFNLMAKFCDRLHFGGRRREVQLKPEPT